MSNLPVELIDSLKAAFGLKWFVETGTCWGETAELAAQHFERVYTIEVYPSLYIAAKHRLGKYSHVTCLLGNSAVILPEVMKWLEEPTLFWIDAHWAGGGTGKTDTECPLLDELKAIGGLSGKHAVIIDDARYFLEPPPEPHQANEWPTFAEIESMVSPWDAHLQVKCCVQSMIILSPSTPAWSVP